MISLSEYTNNHIINEKLISEGFIDNLTKFFGGNFGKIKGGISNFTKEVKSLPEKTKQLYKLTMYSITDIKDNDEKKAAQELIDRYSDCKTVDEICKANIDYLNSYDFPKSTFTTKLVVLTNDMIKKYNGQLSDEVKNWNAKESLQKLDQSTKEEVLNQVKNLGNENKTQQEQQPSQTSNDTTKELADKAGVDGKKLSAELLKILPDKENWNDDKADEIIAGLSSTICGILSVQDSIGGVDVVKATLTSIGIQNPDEFLQAIKK